LFNDIEAIFARHESFLSYLAGRDQEDHGLGTAQARKARKTPISSSKSGMVVCAYDPTYWEAGLRPALGKIYVSLFTTWKITKAKKVGVLAQVIKHLPSKCMALSSNPCTTKKKGKELKKLWRSALQPCEWTSHY
jgi:hypothetical protein